MQSLVYRAKEIQFSNDYGPFNLSDKSDSLFSINHEFGIHDRLRAVAIVELQARDGFLWGVENFKKSAP